MKELERQIDRQEKLIDHYKGQLLITRDDKTREHYEKLFFVFSCQKQVPPTVKGVSREDKRVLQARKGGNK